MSDSSSDSGSRQMVSQPSSGRPRAWSLLSRPGSVAPWGAAAVLVVTISLAYWGKAVCLDGETGFWGLNRYCYSDVRVLWSFRGFDVDAVPYTPPPPGYVSDYVTEYPPGLAFPAWLIGVLTETREGFFNLTALTFAAAAFVTLRRLDAALVALGRSRWRLLGFALSPGLVLFGMQNWDLWAVVLVAGGLAAAATRRPYEAAMWFGLGAAVKWWPALLLMTLVVGPWRPMPPAGRERGTSWLRPWAGAADLRPAGLGVGVWAALQVPAVLISPGGWWDSIGFHLRRQANLDSTVSAIGSFGSRRFPSSFWSDWYAEVSTVVTLGLLLGGIALVAWLLHRGRLEPANAALALVALFLLTGKVFSPQFVVWLLPVAVLASVSWTPVLAVEATNASVWFLYGPWMANASEPEWGGFLDASQGMSIVRTLAVAWLVAAALVGTRWQSVPRLPGVEQADEHHAETADR
ncbi:MAG: glycosyltransferase 87 family protein [Nitriliruptorales bacterium]